VIVVCSTQHALKNIASDNGDNIFSVEQKLEHIKDKLKEIKL